MSGAGNGRHVLVCSWRDRWHPDAGGAELYLHRVLQWLVDAGWRVTVVTAAYPGAAAREHRDGVRYVRRGGTFTVYPWAALLYLLGRLGRPDVIVDVQNGIPFLASVWSRRPVVVLHHHAHREQWRVLFGEVLGRIGWWVESMVAPVLQRRARYVTVSAASREDLVSQGVAPTRIAVVHNGVDPPEVPAPPPSPAPRLAVLGRLVPHKRVELAIDTLATLREHVAGLTLDVIGDGAWRDSLEEHARRTGTAELVRFHGHVDEATKARLLGEAWVLLLPSVKEGWGLVVMEAATVGTPTVAFAGAGGVRESVRDGRTGLLVADHEAFVAATRRLLVDHALRRRMAAAARVHAERFSWAATGRRFAAVLEAASRAASR